MGEFRRTVDAHPFMTVWRVNALQYIIVPKALLLSASSFGLSSEEALLYCILRSRASYSYRNNWVDANGRIFIIFTREQAQKAMGWANKKAIAAFRHLAEAGLIFEEEHQQYGKKIRRQTRAKARSAATPSGRSKTGLCHA